MHNDKVCDGFFQCFGVHASGAKFRGWMQSIKVGKGHEDGELAYGDDVIFAPLEFELKWHGDPDEITPTNGQLPSCQASEVGTRPFRAVGLSNYGTMHRPTFAAWRFEGIDVIVADHAKLESPVVCSGSHDQPLLLEMFDVGMISNDMTACTMAWRHHFDRHFGLRSALADDGFGMLSYDGKLRPTGSYTSSLEWQKELIGGGSCQEEDCPCGMECEWYWLRMLRAHMQGLADNGEKSADVYMNIKEAKPCKKQFVIPDGIAALIGVMQW